MSPYVKYKKESISYKVIIYIIPTLSYMNEEINKHISCDIHHIRIFGLFHYTTYTRHSIKTGYTIINSRYVPILVFCFKLYAYKFIFPIHGKITPGGGSLLWSRLPIVSNIIGYNIVHKMLISITLVLSISFLLVCMTSYFRFYYQFSN